MRTGYTSQSSASPVKKLAAVEADSEATMHLERVILRTDLFPTVDIYPFDLEILRRSSEISLKSPIVFFAGENGTGKSTLLRAITHRCGVHIWANPDCRLATPNPFEGQLHRYIEITWADGPVPGSFFSSEHFRYFSERVEDWADGDRGLFNSFGGKSLLAQSHGQSLMSFFTSRYGIKGVYFLDEPETALSPRRQLDLLRLLREMAEAGHAQFVIATHSPILLSCPGAVIFSFDHVPIRVVDYRETDNYRVFRDFMAAQNSKPLPSTED